MRLTASIQLLIVVLSAQSLASPVAAPPSADVADVASRDFTDFSTDTATIEKRSFQHSCSGCRLGDYSGNPTLSCDCKAPGGSVIWTSLRSTSASPTATASCRGQRSQYYLPSPGPSGPIKYCC